MDKRVILNWQELDGNCEERVYGAFTKVTKYDLIRALTNLGAYGRHYEYILEHSCEHNHDCCGCLFKQLFSFKSMGAYTVVLRRDYFNV